MFSENLELRSLKRDHITYGKVIASTPLNRGVESKVRISLLIERPNNEFSGKTVNLILKKLKIVNTENRTSDNQDSVDIYGEMWHQMKDAGLPVVPVLRRVSEDVIAMTDLEADGSVTYGKEDHFDLRFNKRRERTLDALFAELDILEVGRQVKELGEIAGSKGVCLPNDDPMLLLLRPDKRWQLIIHDLGAAHLNVLPRIAQRFNTPLTDFFSNMLFRVQDELRRRPASSPPHI